MILLGGIAIVLWRIFGKRRNQYDDEDEDLNSPDDSIAREKRRKGNMPFQTNLEQYHSPGGRVNAASNF